MIYLQLFFEFLKTGLFAVGGGLATLPFLYDLSDRTGWFTHLDLTNMIAVSESTPGPIGVNAATYVGYTVAGLPGAIVSTLGLVAPSIIVIVLVARALARWRNNKQIDSVFYGLRPASAGLIAAAGVSVAKVSFLSSSPMPALPEGTVALVRMPTLADVNWLAVTLAVALFFAVKKWNKLHPVVFIAVGALAGILLQMG